MMLALLLAALAVPEQPTSTQPSPPPAAPSYSLAMGRQVQYWPGGDWACVRLRDELICPRHSSVRYDLVRSLAGPPVEGQYEGYTVADRAWRYEPVLFVINRNPDDPRVEIQAVADASGRACVSAAELRELGWHPSGPGILQVDGGICADLSPLFSIWAPNEAVTPISVDGVPVQPVRASLIVGRIASQRESALPPCPPGERCYRWVRDTRMMDVETLSGMAVPPSVTITLTQDTAPPDTEEILMIVRRDRDGRWVGYWTWPAAPAGRETCYRSYETAGFTIERPRRAYARRQETCIAL